MQQHSAAAIIFPDGRIRSFEGGGFVDREPSAFWAEGSGRDIAIGAMAMGATAGRAVQVASTFDAYTGGTITVLRHKI